MIPITSPQNEYEYEKHALFTELRGAQADLIASMRDMKIPYHIYEERKKRFLSLFKQYWNFDKENGK